MAPDGTAAHSTLELRVETDPISELADRRLKRMYLTKGTRFEAARRHKKSARASTISIVILSLYVFSISVVLLTFQNETSQEFTSVLKSLSLIMSFFIVAFSLIQAAKRHELRAEMFIKCAQAIDEIWTNLDRDKTLRKLSVDSIERYDHEYIRTVVNFPDNHSDMDYHVFRLKTVDNPKNRDRITSRAWGRLRRAYWKTRTVLYIWKTVILAIIFPWVIITAYIYAKYTLQLI